MATDKRLDQVSQLTDFDYALIVKGDQVAKASKQQLAELVGDLLYGATNASSLASVVAGRFMFGALASSADVDSLTGFGFYSVGGIQNTSLPTGYGILMCFQTNGWYDRIQIFIPTDNSTNVSFRVATQNGGFGSWKKIAFAN